MAILSPALHDIRTITELADALNVPAPALRLVALSSTACLRSNCSLSAETNNRGYCILCSQRWFPREFDAKGRPSANCRGHGLYGPQFQRQFTPLCPTTCACSNALCMGIGYSHHGMFCFPTDPKHAAEAARIVGVSPAVREKIAANPAAFHIAPWHFNAHHRARDASGSWRLRKMEVYEDSDRKSFPFPPQRQCCKIH